MNDLAEAHTKFIFSNKIAQQSTVFSPKLRVATYVVDHYQDECFAELGVYKPAHIEGAVAKRKAEFLAGRYVAKLLLEEYGFGNYRLDFDAHRCPIWPGGLVGSISHSNSIAIATVGLTRVMQGVGIDVEKIFDYQLYKLIKNQLFSEKEQVNFESLGEPFLIAATIAFSVKESLFKALFPTVKRYFDFSDVEIENIDFKSGNISLSLASWLTCYLLPGARLRSVFIVSDQHVVTQVVVDLF